MSGMDGNRENYEREDQTSNNFTFARPNFVFSPEKITNFGPTSDHVFSKRIESENVFTFAAPVSLSQLQARQNEHFPKTNVGERTYVPKISRNVFARVTKKIPSPREVKDQKKLLEDLDQLKKHTKRRVSAKEDVANSITCENVPKSLMKRTVAKDYFAKFGQILKVTLRPKKQTITICYSTIESARVAYREAGDYLGEKFNVRWSSTDVPSEPGKKTVSAKDMVRKFLTADDEEVNSELAAMMGLEYNMHGESVAKTGVAKPRLKQTKLPTSQNLSKPKKLDKLPVKLEKVHVKSEKMDTDDPSSITIVPKATIADLRNIIRQQAHTAEEKYKILEARDRLIRLMQIKPNTLAMAKVTRGTCPDMCPEKERLMRESQRQVALYEQVDGREYRINHSKAIKQYSRSSADQEEPLAHELRPVECLKMTMSYLLHEIMDMCMLDSTNLADWFHFLWDRTRGIRKDITQQELCCVNSVELVEQCARFHIICSERLCAEEPSVFDKKINTENLTKCLQTLKYMYHDLRVKGTVCPNEAEFRGYVILLNLNDGNFMWDVQQLPKEIQKSSEVRFAINVYSSIESHNFSRFFKLVRKTTYLNACILLRYFNQVRMKAISIMVKAYCKNPSTQFPLYELIDILAFEDENEAITFCEHVGLNLSTDELHITLKRHNVTHPISALEQGRAINVVEYKRTLPGMSVGQCVAGNVLPERSYETHVPLDSFDANGYLKADTLIAEDQTDSQKNTTKKVDPYEFKDEEMSQPQKQILRTKLAIQTEIGFRKKQDVSESSTKVSGLGEGFGDTLKQSALFQTSRNAEQTINQDPFAEGTSIRSKTSTTSQKLQGNSVKSDVNSPFVRTETKTPFGVSSRQTSEKLADAESQKSESIFGLQNRNFGVFSGLNNHHDPNVRRGHSVGDGGTSVKRGDSSTSSTPFSMSLNKSIFSGDTHGNMFAIPVTSTSIFGNRDERDKSIGSKSKESEEARRSNRNEKSAREGIERKEQKKLEAKMRQKEREEEAQKKLEAKMRQKQLEEVQKQLELEKLRLKKLEREKTLRRIESEAKETAEEIEDEIIGDMCAAILKEEMDRIKMYTTLATNVSESIVAQAVCDFCDELLQEELRIERGLREISGRIERRLIAKYYKCWRQNSTRKRTQRQALDDTPVWLQNVSVDECAELLYHPEQDLVIDGMRRKKLKEEPKPQKPTLAPIEVIVYLGMKENSKGQEKMAQKIFWKLVISWPHLEHRLSLWQQRKVMNTYLNPEDYSLDPILKIYKPNPYETLHICVRHFEGIINERNLVGTDGLLFLASSSEKLNDVKRRLSKTILSGSRLVPIPVVVVFLGDDNLRAIEIEQDLDLEVLLECGYVSEYTLIFEKEMSETKILRVIQSAALWLTTNRPQSIPLEMDYLREVSSGCLTQELWLRVQGQSDFNMHLASGLNDPALVVSLHNEAVGHLIDILLDPESLNYTEFPTEFKPFLDNRGSLPISYEYFDDAWRKEDNREEIEQAMSRLLLPDWKDTWPTANVPEFHDAVKSYCYQALPDSDCTTTTCEILTSLFLMTDDTRRISFIDLVLEIVKRKILLIDPSLKVVYNKNHVKHFRTLPWWLKSETLVEYISAQENASIEEIEEPVEKRTRFEESEEEIFDSIEDSNEGIFDSSLYKPNDSLDIFCKETRSKISSILEISQKLDRDIEEQRSRNKQMNEMLERALLDENITL